MYFYIIPAARWELGIQGTAIVEENSAMFRHNPCVRGCSRASCLLGCHAEGLELFTERQHTALCTVQRAGDILQFTPACAGLESNYEWKRNFRSRTQIFLRAGRISFVLSMLHRLFLNFSLFFLQVCAVTCLLACSVLETPLLSTPLLSILCNLAWSWKEEEVVCFAVGT